MQTMLRIKPAMASLHDGKDQTEDTRLAKRQTDNTEHQHLCGAAGILLTILITHSFLLSATKLLIKRGRLLLVDGVLSQPR